MCLDCGSVTIGKHRCMKRSCPNCYEYWAWREALPAAQKVLYNRKGRKIIHGVVSFEGKPEQIMECRKIAYDILSEHGVLSGVLIPHHERHGKVDGYLHYHFLGFIRVNGQYRPGFKGWYVFKVIRWINDTGSLAQTIKYFLTHCTLINNKHTVTYFGEKFKKIQKLKKNEQNCSYCGGKCIVKMPLVDYTKGFGRGELIEVRSSRTNYG